MIATIYKPVDPGGRRSLTRVDELAGRLSNLFVQNAA